MSDAPLLIWAEQVVIPGGVLAPGAVRVIGGRIHRVDRAAAFAEPPHLSGALLLPGFIDLHWHGFDSYALDDGEEAVRQAVRRVARTGVTTCYAGLGVAPTLPALAETVAGAAAVVDTDTGGARLAGVFLEAPYISVERKGAWRAEWLRAPGLAELVALVAASEERIRRVNVAPELPGALAFIRAARARGIVVSLGHSNATYEQALAGVAAGATISNHTFNAMSGPGHREPGLAGAALTIDTLLAELILDGVHVHPAAARMLFRSRGAGGAALISDGLAMTGLPDGRYLQGGRGLIVAAGACTLEDGTLAGSVAPFDQQLRNAARWLTRDPAELAALSSGNAARWMGIDGHTGALAPGKDADLVLLDTDLAVVATVVRGRVVYRRDARDGA